jgi:hypothetical protein
VSSAISTSDLVKVSIITSSLGTAKMLIVANFTGYLEQNGRRKKMPTNWKSYLDMQLATIALQCGLNHR